MYNNDAYIFDPVYIKKPWGGSKLTGEIGIGEAFLISDIKGSETRLANQTLASIMKDKESHFLGSNVVKKYGVKLPIYMKELDAIDNLSVQVHPNNEKAKSLENEDFGKSESWYILSSGESGGIYLGFKQHVTKKILKEALENSQDISELLNFIPVKAGDFFYIPAGLVHAIGKNVHLLEPQQNSNRTYRVWDWNRVDETGKGRELHIDKSLEVLNFDKDFNKKHSMHLSPKGHSLLESEYFNVELISAKEEFTFDKLDSYRIMTLISGEISISFDNQGESQLLPHKACFIPAFCKRIKITPTEETKILITYPK